jgi:hypothetical protein
MSRILVDIESLVFDGVAMDRARGRRLALLAQEALERMLRNRGLAAPPAVGAGPAKPAEVKATPESSDLRWAQELAETLCRALDRKT